MYCYFFLEILHCSLEIFYLLFRLRISFFDGEQCIFFGVFGYCFIIWRFFFFLPDSLSSDIQRVVIFCCFWYNLVLSWFFYLVVQSRFRWMLLWFRSASRINIKIKSEVVNMSPMMAVEGSFSVQWIEFCKEWHPCSECSFYNKHHGVSICVGKFAYMLLGLFQPFPIAFYVNTYMQSGVL